jgi:urease accessory protein
LTDWLFLQLADSAFPTGGFAHSFGLEAARQQGEVPDAATLERFVLEALWQAGYGGLPLASESFENWGENPERVGDLDAACELFLTNPVANRASRAQGRAFLSTCARSFGIDEAALKGAAPLRHHAPLVGAVFRELGQPLEAMQRIFLFGTARGVLSAGVRLGILGPFESQRMLRRLGPSFDAVLGRCGGLRVGDLAQTAPWLDLFQCGHDQLYSRLFQS